MDLFSEEWRAVPGFEGQYEVSDLGRVRSLDRLVSYTSTRGNTFKVMRKGQMLRPGRMNDFGHVSVMLGRDGGSYCVHYLVMRAFVGPRPEGHDVAHKNGRGGDNQRLNLRYATRTENNYDRAKLERCVYSQSVVEDIKTKRLNRQAFADLYGCSRSYVHQVQNGDLRPYV